MADEPQNPAPDQQGGDAPVYTTETPEPVSPPAERVVEFPANTPVAEMTDGEAAAYWKHQSRKHETAAKARSDYDDLKSKAAELEKIQRERMTEHEKALEQARNEGRSTALAEANENAATAILRAQLANAGKDEDEVEKILARVNPRSFVADDAVDTSSIAGFAAQFATQIAAANQGGSPIDLGQGRRSSGPQSEDDAIYSRLFGK